MAQKIPYLIMVPMVYLAVAVFVVGILYHGVRWLTGRRHPSTLRIFDGRGPSRLGAFGDALLMPQVRRHAPWFWVFLLIYHIAFLLLILAHLDLIPGIGIMPAGSKHMLGAGAVGVAVTVSLLYFLLRRFRGPVRDISVFGDYLLLLLLLFTFLTGDTISWANSWNENGFVLGKAEFGQYLQGLLRFKFADPHEVLYGSHYIVVVLHVLLANLFLILFPFTKIMHTFFTVPLNALRRG
jgi:nitrate reductase gamma subunit